MWYALGYGGNGVASSTWAGKRIAEQVAGKNAGREVFNLPIYNSPLEYPNVWNMVRMEAFAPFRRFGQFFLEGGMVDGQPVLPDGWTDRAGLPVTLKDGSTADYGLMWWPAWTEQSVAHKAYAAVGIQGQNIYIDPAERVVIAMTAAQPEPLGKEPVDPMAFFDAVVNAIGK